MGIFKWIKTDFAIDEFSIFYIFISIGIDIIKSFE